MIVDKICNQQVLGCLMKHPQFFSEVDKYHFTLEDFMQFMRIICTFSPLPVIFVNVEDIINKYCKKEIIVTLF